MSNEESVKGVVVRRVKIAGGEEITLQVNDADDETPISGTGGGFSQETDAEGKRAYEAAQKGDESKVQSTEDKKEAPAVKPSAVSKSTASNK